jgi:hypothetical protein
MGHHADRDVGIDRPMRGLFSKNEVQPPEAWPREYRWPGLYGSGLIWIIQPPK